MEKRTLIEIEYDNTIGIVYGEVVQLYIVYSIGTYMYVCCGFIANEIYLMVDMRPESIRYSPAGRFVLKSDKKFVGRMTGARVKDG